jgi:hypothetical protein
MSHSNSQSESFELLLRDAKGEYRLATGDEVLKAARQVIGRRVRRGTSLTSERLSALRAIDPEFVGTKKSQPVN